MRLLGALLLLTAAMPAIAAEPRTCLVLSGGGARGIAHVGVLKVLERNRIPIDCIIGTSMGSVAGSLYAAGLSAAEIEAAVGEVDWGGLFFDRVERQHRSLREKSEDRGFLVRAVLGLRGGRLALPQGVFQGQRLGQALRGLQLPVAGVDDFDELPIPFRAVTADLESGQAVVLGEGDLSRAVRASMAVPGMFSPVEIDGRPLVDGGVAKNLPIDEAIALEATRIIAVDISSPLKTPDELLHSLAISEQMLAALMLRETQRQIERLGPDDVLLRPELGDLSPTDFVGAAEIAVAAGEAAAEEALPALQDLALDEAAWNTWNRQRRRRVHELGPVRAVRIDNRSRMADAAVRKLLPVHPPVPPDREAIEAAIDRLYGTGEFAHVDYSLQRDDAEDTVLTYHLIDRDWDTTGLRMGLRLEDNFDGSSNFQLAARLRQRKINALGGEWLALVQVGKIGMAATEWYQPLDYGRRWFFRPRLEFEARNQPFLEAGETDLQLRRRGLELRTEFGRNLGNLAEVYAGPLVRRTRYAPRRGGQEDDSATFYLTTGGFSAGVLVDTLDDVVFPSSGWWLEVAHRRYLERWSSIDNAFVTDYALGRAFSAGPMRFVLSVDGRYASDLFAPEEVAFLGGFQRLSGFTEDELFGRISLLGRLVALQPLRRSSRFPIYAGATLEAGNTFLDSGEVRGSALITAGSLFLGARTPIGPIYLGGGLAEGGERSVYLFVGQPF